MEAGIITHETWQEGPLTRRFVAQLAAHGITVAPPSDIDALPIVAASINHGRWIATCPADCGSAAVVSFQTPIFICAEPRQVCGRGKTWYQVRFPPPEQRAEIESILLRRPLRDGWPVNRNWVWGESVAMLTQENVAHGVD
tara:strand:- start:1090 stop:1512 length:423 start_codon:yes stop_codon:yes gene_type:complete